MSEHNGQRHIIKRQVLELSIPSAENAYQLQTEISRIYHQHIVPLIEQACSALSSPDLIQRIEAVELDLGRIDPDNLEHDLVARVEALLEPQLAEVLKGQERQAAGLGTDVRTTSQLELFTFFAQHGYLPWWADLSQADLLHHSLRTLMQQAPDLLRQSMQTVAQDTRSLVRLVQHYTDEDLAALVRLLAASPALAGFTQQLVAVMSRLTNRPVLAGKSTLQLRNAAWSSILAVVSHADSQADSASSHKVILVRVASALGLPYASLVSWLFQGLQASQASQASRETDERQFKQTVESLHREEADSFLTRFERLLVVFRSMAAHLPTESRAQMEGTLRRIERTSIHTDTDTPGQLLAFLRSCFSDRDGTPRLPLRVVQHWQAELHQVAVSHHLPPEWQPVLREIVGLLDTPPTTAPDRSADHSADRSGLPSQQLPVSRLDDWRTELQQAAAADLSPNLVTAVADLRSNMQHATDSSLPQDRPAPLDLSFSDADELYIDNAGLVIIWPFLHNFFRRLGFLEDKQFTDVMAQQRAIGVLQYLASQDASPPEYLLPLNKVLCGMPLGEVCGCDPPVSDSEAEECHGLLTAVIAQAPILRNMSIAGFRGSFLLRRGMLSTRDSGWLLRVERETYDVVLDRFPWSIEWVKLPWMAALLQVEW